MSADRTVHAVLANGDEIVRYDRAGKWYREWLLPAPSGRWRNALTLANAAALAAQDSSRRHYDRPGGRVFDARVRRIRGEGS